MMFRELIDDKGANFGGRTLVELMVEWSSFDALDVMGQWITNIRAHSHLSIAENRDRPLRC